MSKWIKVSERKPKTELSDKIHFATVEVLVTNGIGVWSADFKEGNTHAYWSSFDPMKGRPITHWQPLPQPPEDTENA